MNLLLSAEPFSLRPSPNDSPDLEILLAEWLTPAATASETVAITADDGYPLQGQFYAARGRPVGAVLINGATGVPQRYYAHYARFLTRRGFAVLTYDYRGIGASIDRHWKGAPPRMHDWGALDLAAALNWLNVRCAGLPLVAVGHSGGGWLLGLAHNNQLLRGQFAIASQNGYFGHWPLRLRPQMAALWHVLMPALTRLFGHLPAAMFGTELPAGVARDWARWCRHPQFMTDEGGQPLRRYFHAFSGRVRLNAIADDHLYAPRRAVAALAPLFRRAQTEVVLCRPQDYGLRAIGHFGWFRPNMPQTLWQDSADWLRATALESTQA